MATDWKNLNFNAKELVATLIFVFTISGVWFKTTFEIQALSTSYNEHVNNSEKKHVLQDSERLELRERIRVLEEDKIRREAIEDAAGFHRMQKIK